MAKSKAVPPASPPAHKKQKSADGPVAAAPRAATPRYPVARAPPHDFLTLFDLLMACGKLDALDLCVLACCSREMRRAVSSAWAGVRAGNSMTLLDSVQRPVDDGDENRQFFGRYVPVDEAGPCVACGCLTRYCHPIVGCLLCAPCGTRAEKAPRNSRLFKYTMISDAGARAHYGVDMEADMTLALRWAQRRLAYTDKTKKQVDARPYAPALAPSLESVLPGRVLVPDDEERPRPHSDVYSSRTTAVFLEREVICLLLEVCGGPRLYTERLLNGDLGLIDPTVFDG